MNISEYEVVYETTKLSGDKENAKGLICAHTHREALFIAEDLIKNIIKVIKEKEGDNENTSDKVVDSSRVDDLDT